jgi:hypothetical protein
MHGEANPVIASNYFRQLIVLTCHKPLVPWVAGLRKSGEAQNGIGRFCWIESEIRF